jgi:hypothetical protein
VILLRRDNPPFVILNNPVLFCFEIKGAFVDGLLADPKLHHLFV